MTLVTRTIKKLLKLKKRIKVVQGGTSAGKTFGIVSILIDKLQTNDKKHCDVISMTIPHLRDGAMKDFKFIMMENEHWQDSCWNDTVKEYSFSNGSTIKFKSVDKLGKAKGPRRDYLLLNEGNEMPWSIVDQLMVRTREDIWIDYNPSAEFWYHTEIKDKMDHDFEIVTYLDNKALDQSVIDYIESKKHNENWWRVYGMGLLGEIEGRIFKGWREVDEIPFEARLIRRGLDFGYTNDPTAIVDIYQYNGGYIIDEQLYRKGMSNREIAEFIKSRKEQVIVIADSAEPKSIDEIKDYGIEIIGADKGKGSILQGIQYIQDQKISYTKKSINLRKEYENYLWKIEQRTGVTLNVPSGGFDHLLDALRYGLNMQIDEQVDDKWFKRVNDDIWGE